MDKTKSDVSALSGLLASCTDVETGGLNAKTDALLEVAAVFLELDENQQLKTLKTHACHIEPFKSAHIDQGTGDFAN